jgi:hypothetical protein
MSVKNNSNNSSGTSVWEVPLHIFTTVFFGQNDRKTDAGSTFF